MGCASQTGTSATRSVCDNTSVTRNSPRKTLHQISTADEHHILLVSQWALYFAQSRFGTTQWGISPSSEPIRRFDFGSPDGPNFSIACDPDKRTWRIVTLDRLPSADIEWILKESLSRADSGDTGSDVAYRASLATEAPEPGNARFDLHFMRLIGDQVRIVGLRRLGRYVVLQFNEEQSDHNNPLLFPRTAITITLYAPGPVAGPLAQKTAITAIQIIAAICTLALGRVIRASTTSVAPVRSEEDIAEARAQQLDTSILTLARDSVPLDIFAELPSRADWEGVARARGALLSYAAALDQATADVATMLFVTTIEALLSPNQPWAQDRVTKRFVEAPQDLCPSAVDDIVNHANAAEAFGIQFRGGQVRRRRQLLNTIYALRSGPNHTGIRVTDGSTPFQFADPSSIRVALLSDLARNAILAYLTKPMSSLIGHPLIDPAPRSIPSVDS